MKISVTERVVLRLICVKKMNKRKALTLPLISACVGAQSQWDELPMQSLKCATTWSCSRSFPMKKRRREGCEWN